MRCGWPGWERPIYSPAVRPRARGATGGAVERAKASKEPGHQAYALRLLGEIDTHHDPPEVERRSLLPPGPRPGRALGSARSQAHCHRGVGTLYATIGQREQARAALWTAIEMYQAMEMTFWLPETEAALAQVEAR